MTTPRTALAALAPIALVWALTGCSDEDEPNERTGPDASASSPTTEPVDYPVEGVDLVAPPPVKGAYREAFQVYVDFERGRRLAARNGEIPNLLAFNAVASVVDPYDEAIKAYGGAPYGGGVSIEFLDVQPRDTVLRIDVCVDATDLVVPDDAPTQLGEATRAPQRIEVRNFEGPWRVSSVEPLDGSC